MIKKNGRNGRGARAPRGARLHFVVLVLSLSLGFVGFSAAPPPDKADVVVLISANAEWKPVRAALAEDAVSRTPYGEFVSKAISTGEKKIPAVYFHGGWGKVRAGASTQYAIDRWKPRLLVNIGTCGGFEGAVRNGDLLLVTKTIVYDIIEMMGDADDAVAEYTTTMDLSWLRKPYPAAVRESLLVSADRDIQPSEISLLRRKYGAVAGDWESGAIAFVAARNAVPCLILRAVSDIVGSHGGEAYGNPGIFEKRTEAIMSQLMAALPAWIGAADKLF